MRADHEGEPARDGEAFRCAVCGYGICVSRAALPGCPMCGACSWRPERSERRGLEQEAGRPSGESGEPGGSLGA